jgi:hypothetical protein
LIESLHGKVNELKQFKSQQDYELLVFTIREKYEQEIISFNERLQNIQMNLQEKVLFKFERKNKTIQII